MDFYQVEGFSKFIKRLYKNITKSNDIEIIILNSSIAIEGLLDLILINIYDLDKYKKFSVYEFLQYLSFDNKLKILQAFKKRYKRSPKKKKESYKNYFNLSYEAFSALKEKYGGSIFKELEELNIKINKAKGIEKLEESIIPKIDNRYNDYLPDHLRRLVQRIDFQKIQQIKKWRNIVSHRWGPEEILSKELKLSKFKLIQHVRRISLETVNNLAGLKFK